jgi:hypothetical protein
MRMLASQQGQRGIDAAAVFDQFAVKMLAQVRLQGRRAFPDIIDNA